MRLFRWLERWWRGLKRLRAIETRILATRRELPPVLQDGTAYLLGYPPGKWVVLNCPCRCGRQIDVNLMTSRRPFWRAGVDAGKLTLYPSLWMPADTCGSHFWIADGRVHWVDEMGPE